MSQHRTDLYVLRIFVVSEASRAKDSFKKFVDSVLQKCARVRALMSDLSNNYTGDPTAVQPLCFYVC